MGGDRLHRSIWLPRPVYEGNPIPHTETSEAQAFLTQNSMCGSTSHPDLGMGLPSIPDSTGPRHRFCVTYASPVHRRNGS